MNTYLLPAFLLVISNTFMTYAWYGHLKFTSKPIWIAILLSWGIAFLEYLFQVPANRIGYVNKIPAANLKILQEVITLVVFVIFARLYLGERLTWNYYVAFAFILCAVAMVVLFRPTAQSRALGPADQPLPGNATSQAHVVPHEHQ